METSRITHYQRLASVLLLQHYGLSLNDTDLADETVVAGLLVQGTAVQEAINPLVEKFHCERIGASAERPSPYLTEQDVLLAAAVLDSQTP
ncbi:TPA: TA system toxin CbtA family protein [Serratia fonticola]